MYGSCILQLDIKKFAGTEKLRSALQEPEGSCVMAAQASGGSVFNMNKWLPSKQVSFDIFWIATSAQFLQGEAVSAISNNLLPFSCCWIYARALSFPGKGTCPMFGGSTHTALLNCYS